jgi:uncharacterized protein (DUF302 family)
MNIRNKLIVTLFAVLSLGSARLNATPTAAPAPAAKSGVIRVQSIYSVEETVEKIKADIAAKGIKFFSTIDQSALASEAGIPLRPSVLLQFGNPPLGIQFLTATPYSGLDWPVRMLVFQDESGAVWVAYTDFGYIGKRHHIEDRDAQLKMASEVAASIASSTTH